jgi:hypothetical protein
VYGRDRNYDEAKRGSRQDRILLHTKGSQKARQGINNGPSNSKDILHFEAKCGYLHAALVFVLHGKYCDLYRKLITIYNIIVRMCSLFIPMICKQIMWAIYDDSRSFFAKMLLPSLPAPLLPKICTKVAL